MAGVLLCETYCAKNPGAFSAAPGSSRTTQTRMRGSLPGLSLMSESRRIDGANRHNGVDLILPPQSTEHAD